MLLNAVCQTQKRLTSGDMFCELIFPFFCFWFLFEELALETSPSIIDTPYITLRQSQNHRSSIQSVIWVFILFSKLLIYSRSFWDRICRRLRVGGGRVGEQNLLQLFITLPIHSALQFVVVHLRGSAKVKLHFCYDMIWYDMIWYDMIWYDIWYMIWYTIWYIWYGMVYDIWYMIRYMIWYDIWYDMIYDISDMVWYDMIGYGIWYDMIWYGMIWYDMIWYGMIWYDMIWYDMIWYMIWYIWYDMIYDIWYIWYGMVWYDMIWYMIWYDIFNCNWVDTRWQ